MFSNGDFMPANFMGAKLESIGASKCSESDAMLFLSKVLEMPPVGGVGLSRSSRKRWQISTMHGFMNAKCLHVTQMVAQIATIPRMA